MCAHVRTVSYNSYKRCMNSFLSPLNKINNNKKKYYYHHTNNNNNYYYYYYEMTHTYILINSYIGA